MKTLTINKDLCIGCGLCQSICPEVFLLGGNFKSEAVGECQDEKKCQEAIDSCPVNAISWRRKESD